MAITSPTQTLNTMEGMMETSSSPPPEKPSEGEEHNQDRPDPPSDVRPSGVRLVFLTVGVMAAVMMVTLDNYNLGTSRSIFLCPAS